MHQSNSRLPLDPATRMYVVELEGVGCPNEKLIQSFLVKNLLSQTLTLIRKEVRRPPRARILKPSYPGWDGISGNSLFAPNGYVSAITFADKGEFWLNLAPFFMPEINQFSQELCDLTKTAFGAHHMRFSLSTISKDQLQKILSHFEFKKTPARPGKK